MKELALAAPLECGPYTDKLDPCALKARLSEVPAQILDKAMADAKARGLEYLEQLKAAGAL